MNERKERERLKFSSGSLPRINYINTLMSSEGPAGCILRIITPQQEILKSRFTRSLPIQFRFFHSQIIFKWVELLPYPFGFEPIRINPKNLFRKIVIVFIISIQTFFLFFQSFTKLLMCVINLNKTL